MRAKDAYDQWMALAERIGEIDAELAALEKERAQVLEADVDARSTMLYAAVHSCNWTEQGFVLELLKAAEAHWPEEVAAARASAAKDAPEVPVDNGPPTRPDGSRPVPPKRPKKHTK